MKFYILFAVLIAVFFYQRIGSTLEGWFQNEEVVQQVERSEEVIVDLAVEVETPAVVLYSTEWCGYCQKTRELFDKHDIAYQEYDIERYAWAHDEYKALGGEGIPLIKVDDQIIKGYDKSKILRLTQAD